MDRGGQLSAGQQTAVKVADLFAVYWYITGPILVRLLAAIVFLIAALTRRRESGASDRESA
jgi:hypothetical protein